jgi:MFS family permease
VPAVSRRQLAPLGLPGFRYLFYATLGSSLGTLLAGVALAIDVKDRTNSGPWVAAVLIVEFLPTVVVGLLLGPLLDRLERRSLMIAADVVRAAVFAALPFAHNAPTIVALALGAGLATGFFRPAVFAGVPNLVPEEQLPEANALLQTVENVSWAVGPVLGGLLTAADGPSAAYWINAGSFVVSLALVWRIPARLLQSEKALTRGHWRDLREGFVASLRSLPLLAVLLSWGLAELAVGAVGLTEVFIAKNTFHAGDFGYGLLYSAIGAGLVLGGFVSSSVLARLGTAQTYGLSLAALALGLVGAAASPDVWVAAGCLGVSGVGNGCAVVCNALLVQRGVADSARGRALTFVMSATFLLAGVGNAVAGAIIDRTGPRWILAFSAGLTFVAAGCGYLLANRAVQAEPGRRPEPESAPEPALDEAEPDWARWANWAS